MCGRCNEGVCQCPSAPSTPIPPQPSSVTAEARLVSLLQQTGVPDDTLLEAACDAAEDQYAAMLLEQQEQRCAAHTARLREEGWFDPKPATDAPSVKPLLQSTEPINPPPASQVVFSIVPKELEAITSMTGKVFTLDASVFPPGVTSSVAKECCTRQQPFTTKDVSGHHSWVCIPPSDLQEYIGHYVEQKKKDPHNTSACFVVPRWRILPHPALATMQVIREYRKGFHLYLQGNKRDKGLLDHTLVYYDPPVPVPPESPHDRLIMQYKCHVHGVKATVLLDSGAEGFCYVSKHFLQTQAIAFKETSQSGIACADGAQRPVYGTVTLNVHMQKYAAKVPCKIIDLDPQFDLIFGQDWLQAHDTVLYMSTGSATLRQKGQLIHLSKLDQYNHVIPESDNTESTPEQPNSDVSSLPCVATITCKAARRAMKKGGLALLVLVTEAQPQPPTPEQQENPKLTQLQEEFGDIFKSELPGLPPYRGVEVEAIKLQDEHIRCRPSPRYSQKEKACITAEVSKLLSKGLIQPSCSPVGHPVLFVKKKDGSLRMVIDYRPTNAKTIRNQFPLPRIDDLLDQLSGSTVWSALDMTSAYHQCRLLESDIGRTAFKVPEGLFEFRVLCFGLTNSPAVFSQMMMKLFRPYIGKFLLIYLDDLLVYSKTEAEHYEHLRLIFQLCRTHQLYLKLSKCEFLKKEVHYLGHVISADGIRVDPGKTKAVDTWPEPKTLKQLRSFLGFANYFRKFIQGFSRLVMPLTNLTKGAANKYQNITHLWSAECQTSFEDVKYALTHAPVLAMPDFSGSKPFEVIADARGDNTSGALGAVLLQDGHPVAYESRKFIDAEVRYTTTEQELLGIIHALKVWRCFLEGVKFTVVTDHCPNTFFSTLPELNRRQARWSEFLQMFDFDWAYRPGRVNVADPLSRIPDPTPVSDAQLSQTVAALCSRVAADLPAGAKAAVAPCNSPPLVELLRTGYATDPCFVDQSFIQKHKLFYSEQQALWLKDTKVVVPDLSHLKYQVFLGAHVHVYAGHFGVQKTEELITRHFWWPGLRDYVQSQVRQCDMCQRNKPLNRPSAGKLMPLPIPGYRWEVVSLDFITDLPKSSTGYDAVCVFVDKLTKMVHIAPTVSDCDAPELAQIFIREIYRLHGLPRQLLHDRGVQFMSKFYTKLCKALDIQQLPSTAFHPQTDGQTERVNRVLEDTLRCFTNAQQTNWDTLLPMVEFAINNSKHASSGFSPFYLNYGLEPKTPLSVQLPQLQEAPTEDYGAPAVTRFVADLQEALRKAKSLLQAAQDRQKACADKRRSPDPDFAVGQEVLLSSKNIPIKHPGSNKLLPRWLGPFRVAKRISSVAYKLELPATMSRIHPVFHASLLKPYFSDGPYQPPPPVILQDGSEEFEVETILSHRDRNVPRSSRMVREYLIKWRGYEHEHNTWEPATNLTNCAELLNEYLARAQVGTGVRRRAAKSSAHHPPARAAKRRRTR